MFHPHHREKLVVYSASITSPARSTPQGALLRKGEALLRITAIIYNPKATPNPVPDSFCSALSAATLILSSRTSLVFVTSSHVGTMLDAVAHMVVHVHLVSR